MVGMKHGLQISLRRCELSMGDKMAAGGFGRAENYGPQALSSPVLKPSNATSWHPWASILVFFILTFPQKLFPIETFKTRYNLINGRAVRRHFAAMNQCYVTMTTDHEISAHLGGVVVFVHRHQFSTRALLFGVIHQSRDSPNFGDRSFEAKGAVQLP